MKQFRNRIVIFILAVSFVGTAFLGFQNNQKALARSELKFVPGELVVKFKDNINTSAGVEALKEDFGAKGASSIFKKPKAERFAKYVNVKLADGEDAEKAAVEYRKNPNVEWAEPNYIYKVATTTPNDTYFTQQWGLTKVQAPQAWDIETGEATVKVAVIDTGVKYDHPDLATNIWQDGSGNYGYDTVNINTALYEAQGYELVPGEDYTTPDYNPSDMHGHGTFAAGIVAACGNNTIGVAGASWQSKIMALRAGFAMRYAGNLEGLLDEDDSAAAIIYAADQGADIINMSWGVNIDSKLMHDAIEYAYDAGATLVAAAGNENTQSPLYPSAYNPGTYNYGGSNYTYHANVLAIAATDSSDIKASFSNYGTWVDVSAPGVSIASTMNSGSPPYGTGSGTSFASPMVAGEAALIKSIDGSLTNAEIINYIKNNVDNIDAQNPSYIGKLGTGRVNFYKAAQAVNSIEGDLTLSNFNITPTTPAVGEEATATFRLTNTSGQTIILDSTGVAVRYGTERFNFDSVAPVTIAPGSYYDYSVKRIFTKTGAYKAWVYYYHNGAGERASSDKYFNVSSLLSKIQIISSSISPSNPCMGEEVTGKLTIKNNMSSSITLDSLGIAVRYGKHNRNYPADTSVTIASGATYTFEKKKTFGGWGYYTWWPYLYFNSTGYSLASKKTFYHYPLTYKLKCTAFSLSDYTPNSGDTVTATLTLQNNASSAIALDSLGVAVRRDGVNANYPAVTGVEAIIPAGSSKTFTLDKVFTPVGTYQTWVYAYCAGYGFRISSYRYFVIDALATGWLYSANSSFTNNLSLLDEVYPFWYEANSSTTSYVKKSWVTIDPNLITTAHTHHIKVLPAITMGSGGASSVKNMITDPTKKGLFIANLLALVKNNNYDGIDIDFEDFSGTLAPYRDEFATFMEDLSRTFHSNSKLVGFAAIPKSSEPGLWSSHIYADWGRIGTAVDRFHIMLYNYKTQNSIPPGPIAPYGWNDEVLDFAKTKMVSKKIFMGLGAWGWSWAKSGTSWSTPAAYWDAEGASNYIASKGLSPTYSASNVKSYYGDYYYTAGYAPHFNYTSSSGTKRQVWYEDAKSSGQKINLMKSKGIGGIAIWRIGAEDRHLWSVIRSKL